ncbi:ureidoglycolate lyase, partial [uncultured Marinobacter sp.]
MLKLTAQPLTPEAFAPFGDVIDSRSATNFFPINGGRTQRHHDLAGVEILGEGGRPMISIFVSQPVQVPLQVDCLERHP